MTQPLWRERAACVGAPIEWFFPPKGHPVAKEAKTLCRICPVSSECLDAALAVGDQFGWWAGRSERERGRIRRARGMRAAYRTTFFTTNTLPGQP